ncbi:hypothetical protein MHU86_19347 [Fragilaria crotonensis]|nr:hypothetical protein MHU86_19347 [Fragilaria crotonensis]
MHETWHGILATDSQSVLDTLFGQDRDDSNENEPLDLDNQCVVLDPLCPEWDILIEIQAALRVLPGVRLQYVEGHQDQKKPYQSLELLEQLNVDADRIAEEYHELLQPQRPYVLLSPHARAHLVFEDGTVTARHAEFIETQATAEPLVQHLAKKHSWSDGVTENINWKAHGQALKRNRQRRSHFVKMVHDILPTTSLQNKYDGGKRTCPLCQHPCEDSDHILRCQHPSRVEWRRQFLHGILEFCNKTHTYPPIRILLITTMQSWLSGEDNPRIERDQYPADMSSIIRQQAKIGWRQMLQGRFSKAWSDIQQRYHELTFPTQQYTPDKWQVGLIQKIWEHRHKVWILRNEDLHGRDIRSRQQAERKEIQRQLHAIYSQRPMMDPRVQSLLLEAPEAHDRYPVQVTKNWIRMHATTFSESVKRVKTRALHGVRSIRSYFNPIPAVDAEAT